jgi:heme o synthase
MKSATVRTERAPFLVELPGAVVAAGRRLGDFAALTKPRLNALVGVTSLVGYSLGRTGPLDVADCAATATGVALVGAGAAVLNQALERRADRVMRRTRHRPLAARRMSGTEALVFSLLLLAAGLVLLARLAGHTAAVLALLAFGSYAGLYTPLKRRTPAAILVGAVPGALPPVVGWAAASGSVATEAWALFAIVFCWQVPHFLAISSMHRNDYARAGFQVLPVVNRDGRRVAREALLFAAALLPASLLPTLIGLAPRWYAGGAVALGVGLLALCVGFAREPDPVRARRLFVGSIVYLPLLSGLLIAGRLAS